MNPTPVPSSRRRLRRLAALAGGVALGATAVLTLASPASAHPVALTGDGACADTGWTANLTLTNNWHDSANVEWIGVYDADGKELPGLHVTGIQKGTHLAESDDQKGGDEVTGTVAVPADITVIEVKAKVVYDKDGVKRSPHTGDISAPKDCGPPPTTPPATESPSPSASPSAPAESPSASESPSPIPGAGGGGPQLPTTGASIGTAVGIAAVLVAAGVGLFFFFRRRRIRFTA